MASKYRPKGSYKELLNLTANEITSLSIPRLRSIVNKLNDVANKRVKRVQSSGYEFASGAVRNRKGKRFSTVEKPSFEGLDDVGIKNAVNAYKSDLKTAYNEVRNFLESKTSSLTGTRDYANKFDEAYEKVLGKPLDDPSNYDRRFKTKKVLKKSVEKKISDFWRKYDEWKEIQVANNPDAAIGDTNDNDVEEFIEELYSQGKTSFDDMTKKAIEDYLEDEDYEEDMNDYESENIQPREPKRPRTGKPKQHKHEGKGNWPKVKYEKIKILD